MAVKCNCLTLTNKALEPMGCALDTGFAIDFKAGKATVAGPYLRLHWIDGHAKRGKKLPTILCAFCPTCGKRLLEEEKKKPTKKARRV